MNLVPSLAVPDHYAEPVHVHAGGDDTAKIFLIDILAAIHRNRGTALAAAGLAALLVLAATYLITPLYKITASVMLDTRREQVVDAPPALVYRMFTGLGGKRGWLYANWTWRLRGIADRLVGGVGLRRGRLHQLVGLGHRRRDRQQQRYRREAEESLRHRVSPG